jgi:hypothetical protein
MINIHMFAFFELFNGLACTFEKFTIEDKFLHASFIEISTILAGYCCLCLCYELVFEAKILLEKSIHFAACVLSAFDIS